MQSGWVQGGDIDSNVSTGVKTQARKHRTHRPGPSPAVSLPSLSALTFDFYDDSFVTVFLSVDRKRVLHFPSRRALAARASLLSTISTTISKLPILTVLCPEFTHRGQCTRGQQCSYFHVATLGLTPREVHVNFAYSCLPAVPYRMLDSTRRGVSVPVYAPNHRLPCDTVALDRILVTAGAAAIDLDDVTKTPPLAHCAHFHFNHLCNRGQDCRFIHVVSVIQHARPGQLAPHPTTVAGPKAVAVSSHHQHHDVVAAVPSVVADSGQCSEGHERHSSVAMAVEPCDAETQKVGHSEFEPLRFSFTVEHLMSSSDHSPLLGPRLPRIVGQDMTRLSPFTALRSPTQLHPAPSPHLNLFSPQESSSLRSGRRSPTAGGRTSPSDDKAIFRSGGTSPRDIAAESATDSEHVVYVAYDGRSATPTKFRYEPYGRRRNSSMTSNSSSESSGVPVLPSSQMQPQRS